MITKTDIELKIVDSVDTSHTDEEVLADSASNPDAFYVGRGYLAKSGQKILESLDPEGEYPDMTVGSASSATRATTAATATTATNISTAPTLAEKNGQITVKVGNKTSNPLTVPFATHAETASDLTGRIEATPEVFTYRPSAGEQSIKDDNAFIRRVKGNSVVFNQVAKEINSTYWGVYNSNNASISFNSNIATVTVTNYASDIYGYAAGACLIQSRPTTPDHKYLIAVEVKSDIAMDFGIELNSTCSEIGFVTNEWTYCTKIATSNRNYTKLIIGPRTPYTAELNTYSFRNLICIDLTQMFGAGNEPTVEEFRALYPDSYYPYNTGELRNLSCFGIRTVGFNQWDGTTQAGYIRDANGVFVASSNYLCTDFIKIIPNQEYFIRTDQENARWAAWYDSDKNFISGISFYNPPYTSPENAAYIRLTIKENEDGNPDTFCINLHHTGYRDGEYERYKEVVHTLPLRQITGGQPLRKAGDVYDEITETEYIKRVGVVDLGSLAWWLSDSDKCLFACNFEYVWQDNSKAANILCAKYVTLDYASVYMESTGIAINFYAGSYYLAICDKSFTDAASFKASLSGVLLQYELAEPIIKPIETPLVLGYYVEDFGTEEAMLAENSAPFSADIIYQFNATDQVRNNTRNLHILQKKALIPSGTAAQYIRGDGSYADIAELSRLTPINDGEFERPDDSAYDILLTLSTHHFAVCPNILDGDSSVGINLTPTDDTASVAEYWLQIQMGDSVPNLAFSAIDDEDAVIVINGTVMINAVNIWHIISTDGGHTYFGEIKNYII